MNEEIGICYSGIIKDMDSMKAEIKQLKKENKKLRECVEFYADKDVYVSAEFEMVIEFNGENQYCEEFGTKARQTLKELDGDN